MDLPLPEEMAYMQEHLLKRYGRKKMEGKGNGEVRRVHIVYFLSRNGRIEHPHLIRVHHTNRNGVRLRDVKRWLAELRGKEMPETFAWSYKRRYKSGYVWQDLLEDDLITPISDNEYVLKGSEISSSPFDERPASSLLKSERPPAEKLPEKPKETAEKSVEFKLVDNSGDKSTEEGEEADSTSREKVSVSFSLSSMSSSSSSPAKVENSIPGKKTENKKPSASAYTFTKSKSVSNGASHIFRNLLSCGAIDTNDSVVSLSSKQKATNGTSSHPNNQTKKGEICRFDTMGGSERFSAKVSDLTQKQEQSRRKSFSGILKRSKKTIAEPHCSQCGKLFKPENLHAHMASCRGMKGNGRGGTAGMKSATGKKKPTAQEQGTNLFLTS